MRILFVTLTFALLLNISACSGIHHFIPNTDTYDFPKDASFNSTHNINVINVSQSSTPFVYGNAGLGSAHKWMGNLKEWTDVAVAITNRELSARGMKISPTASKSLKLSILEATATSGGWGFRGNVSLKVVTGAGFEHVYQGESPAMMINRSADGAIMQAVAAMLRDKNIVTYLRN